MQSPLVPSEGTFFHRALQPGSGALQCIFGSIFMGKQHSMDHCWQSKIKMTSRKLGYIWHELVQYNLDPAVRSQLGASIKKRH